MLLKAAMQALGPWRRPCSSSSHGFSALSLSSLPSSSSSSSSTPLRRRRGGSHPPLRSPAAAAAAAHRRRRRHCCSSGRTVRAHAAAWSGSSSDTARSATPAAVQTSVVGCLIEHDNKVLLCKRNIEPSNGLWTLPAGYMEIGESAAEGAIRETWEEACAEVEVLSPFAQLDIPRIGQTYVIFLAKLRNPHFSPGPESSDCQLFALDDIPFDSLAFSSILVTLKLYIQDVKNGRPRFHYGTINKRPGSSPSDIRAHTLDYHLQS